MASLQTQLQDQLHGAIDAAQAAASFQSEAQGRFSSVVTRLQEVASGPSALLQGLEIDTFHWPELSSVGDMSFTLPDLPAWDPSKAWERLQGNWELSQSFEASQSMYTCGHISGSI